ARTGGHGAATGCRCAHVTAADRRRRTLFATVGPGSIERGNLLRREPRPAARSQQGKGGNEDGRGPPAPSRCPRRQAENHILTFGCGLAAFGLSCSRPARALSRERGSPWESS